jgi:site-specific DNA-methyltransferase (adenine-specific)
MAVRIEDAGFEIRDMIAWVYGSGFPKSLDVSKAIDKAAGVEREVVGFNENWRTSKSEIACPQQENQATITTPATPEAKQWEGWGTALKPALEPITVARKPLIGTVAENVLQHGTGAINVDGGRVGTEGGGTHCNNRDANGKCLGHDNAGRSTSGETFHAEDSSGGRWPANFIHDGSEEATDLLGASARFFYCAKASKADRDEGCEGLEAKQVFGDEGGTYQGLSNSKKPSCNHHPTVKPTDLMRYLCRLVTPPSGTVLDPFMGSGSTGKAAMLEGFAFVGIEREAEYVEIAKARIEAVKNLF